MVLSLLDDVLLEFQDGVFDGQSPVLWVEGVVALSDFPKFLYGLQIRTWYLALIEINTTV